MSSQESKKEGWKILIADDIQENLDLLEAYLITVSDYELIFAKDGVEALEQAKSNDPDLILLDVMMPGMTGVQVCAHLRRLPEFQFTPILMVTSLSEVEDRVSAIEAGATDFLSKPVNRLELTTRIKSLLGQKSLHDDLVNSYEIIATLNRAIEARDPYTRGHSERVSKISREFATFMELPPSEVDSVEKAALLHDIGKIGISDTILNKPGKLTEDEYNSIVDHPIIGADIIESVRALRHLSPMIRHHHERYDGKGHPDGLKDNEIPLGARIISIIDTFDAIVSRRVYDRVRTYDDAIGVFQNEREQGQWDPELVDRFMEFLQLHKDQYETFDDATTNRGNISASR